MGRGGLAGAWWTCCVVVEDELVVVVVLEDEDVVGSVYLPTVIVTVLPFLAVALPPGFWLITIPFWVRPMTFLVSCTTLKPAAFSALTAPATGSPVTGGTLAVPGPWRR